MARAVVMDVEGTLIDAVDLHVRAWQESLARFEKHLSHDALRSALGRRGNELAGELLTADERAAFGEELEEHRAQLYRRRFLPWARPFPQARDLLLRFKQARVLVGLAATCDRREMARYLALLDGASAVDVVSTTEGADRSRPATLAFKDCLSQLKVRARYALAIADSPFDVGAARRAGIETVGVLSGGFAASALGEAGCVAVYQDVGEVLARLGHEPLVLEPARARP